MHSPEDVKFLVQQNIDQIKIGEFVDEGGWPNIDAIDVFILSQQEEAGVEKIRLQILYTVDKAGCCFIPGGEEQKRLTKIVTIINNQVKFEKDE